MDLELDIFRGLFHATATSTQVSLWTHARAIYMSMQREPHMSALCSRCDKWSKKYVYINKYIYIYLYIYFIYIYIYQWYWCTDVYSISLVSIISVASYTFCILSESKCRVNQYYVWIFTHQLSISWCQKPHFKVQLNIRTPCHFFLTQLMKWPRKSGIWACLKHLLVHHSGSDCLGIKKPSPELICLGQRASHGFSPKDGAARMHYCQHIFAR